VPIYFVRHAKAGSRSAWIGDDRDRPLVDNGWEQARALATRLSALNPSVLWSSPYLRCQQTLQPLGELCGLEVVVDSRLEEESPLEKSLAILDDAPDNAVLFLLRLVWQRFPSLGLLIRTDLFAYASWVR